MNKKTPEPLGVFKSYDLSDGWHMRQQDDPGAEWLSCSVPTNVHLDLLSHGKIPDPFIGFNELDVEWVAEKTWTYKTVLPQIESSASSRIVLVFDGLDTFATVKINGAECLRSTNMFIAHSLDITEIYDGSNQNTLEIDFESALLKGRELVEKQPHHKWLCSNGEPSRLPVRKAQYHWGWDWGPILNTCGPWKRIRLETFQARLASLEVETTLSEDMKTAEIIPLTRVDVSDIDRDMWVRYELEIHGEVLGETVSFADPENNYHVSENFVIDLPELWYPRGYGQQALHTVRAILYVTGGVELHRLTARVGLRKAQLITDKDAHGESFYFRINDIDVFCGGSNWIPADTFPPRVSWDKSQRWLELAVAGNQNMIRVWGGGIYESDEFYDMCDELGILVWQDFMFACGNYPANPSFLSSIEKECATQLHRFQHHPCIVVYAGNNEDYQIREQFDLDYDADDDVPKHWLKSDFPARYIYELVIPTTISNSLSERPYRCGSPWSHGKATGDPRFGDQHQWNVWHGTQEKYQIFDKLGGRFISEFGMEAFPHIQTIRDFCLDESELYSASATVDFHNKATGHERRIATYVAENFQMRSDLEGFIHLTQLVQSEAMMFAYRGFRKQWGHGRKCGGALVWQLNDCWPGISWSICDYYLRKKPAFYTIARALAPLAVGVRREHQDWSEGHARPPKTSSYDLWVVSSRLEEVEATVELRFISVKTGKDIKDPVTHESVKIKLNGTTRIEHGVIDNEKEEAHVLAARLLVGGHVVARDVDWPQPFKYLSFEDRGLQVDFDGKDTISIKAQKPVKGLVFEERDGLILSDSCVDIVPGDDQTITVQEFPDGAKPLSWHYLGSD